MAGTSPGNSVESIYDYYCFHCQAGRFDLVDSTAFMDVGCTPLYSEIPPSLVTGHRAIRVEIFWFQLVRFFLLCVNITCLPLLTFLSLPTVTGVSLLADFESSLGTFPTAWFVVYLSKKEEEK